MRAITIYQPWASLIAHGYKKPENRGRLIRHQGPMLIHAAAPRSDAKELQTWATAERLIKTRFNTAEARPMLDLIRNWQGLPRGGIVGIGYIDSTTRNNPMVRQDRFFVGPEAYNFAEAVPLEFERCRGAQGVWNYKGEMHANAAEKLTGPTLARSFFDLWSHSENYWFVYDKSGRLHAHDRAAPICNRTRETLCGVSYESIAVAFKDNQPRAICHTCAQKLDNLKKQLAAPTT